MSIKKPNILFIFSDQQHWNALGVKDAFFETPNQDKIYKESIVFENAFCTTPQCSPSRSSILTGLYPSKTNVIGNIGNAGGNELKNKTIGYYLKDGGYYTGYFGKWHLGNNEIGTSGWKKKKFTKNDTKSCKKALKFLGKLKNLSKKPFALFVSFNNPHDIYQYPFHSIKKNLKDFELPISWYKTNLNNRPNVQMQFMKEDQGKWIYEKDIKEWKKYHDCYKEKTRSYDEKLGKILEKLEEIGEYENTIIFITSDHGDMDTAHKLIFKGPFMYENLIRIPLIIHVPKKFGGIGSQVISNFDSVNVDLFPTILDLCGLKSVENDGKSLKSFLTGKNDVKNRDFVIIQYYSKQKWINPIRTIRTKKYKYNSFRQ